MRVSVVRRPGARILLLGPGDRLLLFRAFGMAGRYAWVPPGGAIEPGEDPPTAARRELAEETGHVGIDIGAAVATVMDRHVVGSRFFDCTEHVFIARVPTLTVDTAGFSDEERWRVATFRWWTIDEVLESAEEFFPRPLPALVESLLR